jgi:hypothetical protein
MKRNLDACCSCVPKKLRPYLCQSFVLYLVHRETHTQLLDARSSDMSASKSYPIRLLAPFDNSERTVTCKVNDRNSSMLHSFLSRLLHLVPYGRPRILTACALRQPSPVKGQPISHFTASDTLIAVGTPQSRNSLLQGSRFVRFALPPAEQNK